MFIACISKTTKIAYNNFQTRSYLVEFVHGLRLRDVPEAVHVAGLGLTQLGNVLEALCEAGYGFLLLCDFSEDAHLQDDANRTVRRIEKV